MSRCQPGISEGEHRSRWRRRARDIQPIRRVHYLSSINGKILVRYIGLCYIYYRNVAPEPAFCGESAIESRRSGSSRLGESFLLTKWTDKRGERPGMADAKNSANVLLDHYRPSHISLSEKYWNWPSIRVQRLPPLACCRGAALSPPFSATHSHNTRGALPFFRENQVWCQVSHLDEAGDSKWQRLRQQNWA